MMGTVFVFGLGVATGWMILERPEWAGSVKTWVVAKVKVLWHRARD